MRVHEDGDLRGLRKLRGPNGMGALAHVLAQFSSRVTLSVRLLYDQQPEMQGAANVIAD